MGAQQQIETMIWNLEQNCPLPGRDTLVRVLKDVQTSMTSSPIPSRGAPTREEIATLIVDMTGAGTLGLTNDASLQAAEPIADAILALFPVEAANGSGWRMVPVEPTNDMIRSINAWADDPSLDGGDIYSRILSHYAEPYAAVKTGHTHTAMMDAIREDIVRQHPGAFTEDTDAEIVIPVGAVPVNLYCKIDVSALAEAALAASPPLAEGQDGKGGAE